MEKSNFIKSFDVCVSKDTHHIEKINTREVKEEIYIQITYKICTHSLRKDIFRKPIGPVPPTSIL